jgi:hypothetical protein
MAAARVFPLLALLLATALAVAVKAPHILHHALTAGDSGTAKHDDPCDERRDPAADVRAPPHVSVLTRARAAVSRRGRATRSSTTCRRPS